MSRYLVLQLARFGDLLQTKRLLLSLAAQGETHLCVDRSLVALARLLFPRVRVHGLAAHGGGDIQDVFTTCRDTLRELGTMKWSAVYNLNWSGLNLALSTFFPSEIVCGHRLEAGQPLRDQWTALGFRWTKRRQGSPLNLVDFWGLLAPYPVSGPEVNPSAAAKGEGLGIVLAGRHARRSLPMDVLVPLAHAVMHGIAGRRAVLLGSRDERGAAKEFLSHAPPALRAICHDYCGRTDWQGLADVVRGLDLLLTPDTGTMHLAAHLGTPVLASFLSSAWAWETGPYGEGHTVLQAVTECAPCVESRPCHNELACLEAFRGRETLRALSKGLDFSGTLPQGLLALKTGFDDLGVTFAPSRGQDPHTAYRQAQRDILREYRLGAAPLPGAQNGAQVLYQERDWMLDHAQHHAPHHCAGACQEEIVP